MMTLSNAFATISLGVESGRRLGLAGGDLLGLRFAVVTSTFDVDHFECSFTSPISTTISLDTTLHDPAVNIYVSVVAQLKVAHMSPTYSRCWRVVNSVTHGTKGRFCTRCSFRLRFCQQSRQTSRLPSPMLVSLPSSPASLFPFWSISISCNEHHCLLILHCLRVVGALRLICGGDWQQSFFLHSIDFFAYRRRLQFGRSLARWSLCCSWSQCTPGMYVVVGFRSGLDVVTLSGFFSAVIVVGGSDWSVHRLRDTCRSRVFSKSMSRRRWSEQIVKMRRTGNDAGDKYCGRLFVRSIVHQST